MFILPNIYFTEFYSNRCQNMISTVHRQIDKALKGKWHRFNDVFCNPDRTIITCLTMSMLTDQRSNLNFNSKLKYQLVII